MADRPLSIRRPPEFSRRPIRPTTPMRSGPPYPQCACGHTQDWHDAYGACEALEGAELCRCEGFTEDASAPTKDVTPAINFGALAQPFPDTAGLLNRYIHNGALPEKMPPVSLAATLAACDRLLSHLDLPTDWRKDIEAIRATCVQPFTTTRRAK